VSIFATIISSTCEECPKPELLKPCTCDKDVISCGGDETLHLKTIFQRLDFELEDGKKHFNKFYLNNTAISELPENTFGDITFDIIEINAKNLSLISTFAFTAVNFRLKEFYCHSTPLRNNPPNYDIFTSLSLMVGIECIWISVTQIHEIPKNAFRPLLGQQKNVTILGFFGNNINHIPNNTFNYLRKSDKHLSINLNENPLNSSSFEVGAFNNLNRPTSIWLPGNQIKYLEQTIFEPFFNDNDKNIIQIDNLDCEDCRSYWLFKNGKYSHQLAEIKCSNNKIFSDNDNFKKCSEKA
jgi:hypothetical protein